MRQEPRFLVHPGIYGLLLRRLLPRFLLFFCVVRMEILGISVFRRRITLDCVRLGHFSCSPPTSWLRAGLTGCGPARTVPGLVSYPITSRCRRGATVNIALRRPSAALPG